MRRHLFASVGLVALLGLTACGVGSNQAESTVSESASPSVSASASASTSAPASPTAAESTAATSAEPTVAATPESTAAAPSSQAPVASQQLAAPGTNCGVADASRTTNSVYVFGGQVSCDEALSTMRAFLPSMTDNVYAQGPGSAEIGGYACQESDRMSRDTGTYAICMNAETAAYVELRGGVVEPIPGNVADSRSFFVGPEKSDFYYAWSSDLTTGNLACGTRSGIDVTCEVVQRNPARGSYLKTWKVVFGTNGEIDISEGGTQDSLAGLYNAQPLDIGTTLNFYGISCQPQAADTMRCVGEKGAGFTISPDGVTQP